jgi:hypothetical protein
MNKVVKTARATFPSFIAVVTPCNLSTRSEHSTGRPRTYAKTSFSSSWGRGANPETVLFSSLIGPIVGPFSSQQTPPASPEGARRRKRIPGKTSMFVKAKPSK